MLHVLMRKNFPPNLNVKTLLTLKVTFSFLEFIKIAFETLERG